MIKQMAEKHGSLIQFIKFGIVGVSNTVVNYVIYLIALRALLSWGVSWRFDYLIAQVVAFLLSVLWSFFWNSKYVFTGGKAGAGTIAGQLLKAYVSYSVTGIFLNGALLLIEIDVFEMSRRAAPLMNLCISVPINFLLNKHWTFGQK